VAFTDVFQLGLIILGMTLVMPFLFDHVGGFSNLIKSYNELMGDQASVIPNKESMGNYFWNWMDYALLLIFGGIPWQVYFQRVLSARSERSAMWLSIFAGMICIIVAIPAALVGMVGATVDWTSLGLAGPDNAASTLPYVFHYLTPGVIALIGLGAIAAAVMSSIDSSMLSAGSLAVWNVYRPLIKPNERPEKLKKILQRSIIIIGIAATVISLKVESVYALWYLCSDLVYCLLFPALVTAMFDKKANRIGALSGLAVAAILRFGGGDNILHIPTLIPYPMIEDGVVLFPFRTLAMVSGLITMIIVSRLTQSINPSVQLESAQDIQ